MLQFYVPRVYADRCNKATGCTWGPRRGTCMSTPSETRQVCLTARSWPQLFTVLCRSCHRTGGDQEVAMPKEYRPGHVHQGRELLSRPLRCATTPVRPSRQDNGAPDLYSIEAQVTLFPYPTYSPPTPLVKTKGALCFALNTTIEYQTPESATPSSPGPSGKGKGVPTVVTRLAVGCRRKIVLYSWKDGEPQEVQVEVTLVRSNGIY